MSVTGISNQWMASRWVMAGLSFEQDSMIARGC
jgi:hypothetical protein